MSTLTELSIIPLISLILYVFILVILMTSNKTKLSNAFSLYIIAMIIWSLGSFLMKTELPPSSTFWNRVLLIGLLPVPVLLLRFTYILAEYHKGKLILNIGYILTAFLVVLGLLGYVVKSAVYTDGNFDYEIAFGAYIFAVVGMFYSILAFTGIISKVRKDEISIKKVRLVIIGLFLVVIGAALNLSPELGKFQIDIIFNGINAVLITYSIYRNKFLEINLVVKKGLSFSLYNIVIFIVYVTSVIFSYQLLILWGVKDIFTIILFMSPVFLILEPFRRIVQRLTEHIFFRATTDRRVILREFSSLVNSALSLEKITGSLIDAIKNGIDSRQVTILLKNANKYKLANTTLKDIIKEELFFKFKHPIVTWFNSGNDLLLSTQINNHVIFKGLWNQEKHVINLLETEIVAPIKYLDELIGLIVISDRNDETPYIEDETYFLQTLINNAAAIIENAKTIENIKRQSITDELTKLYNHRYFHDVISELLINNKLETYCIAMIDIDQFKIYNDLYGHAEGDVALKRIALNISNNTAKDNILARYGGEEFVIFMPNINGEDALKAIEHIRKAVENEFLLSDELKEFLTVTIGVACYPNHGTTLEQIISKADESMFYGKQSGRNKAILYKDINSESRIFDDEVQEKIKAAYLSSIYALAATIDAKDHYTFGHSNNVSMLAAELAKEAKLEEKDIEIVRNAGLLHDIGKVGIPESVLSKPGFLTEEEMNVMKTHVVQSINIIKHIPNLLDTVPVIVSHHERFDGKGYPRGIKGESIPLLGRVICIADSFDAMTTDRPYRKGLSLEQSIDELKRNSGTQFDPQLVILFIEMIKDKKISSLNLENRIF